jgi:membrane-bound metal-dependent hydrolase YbcI (DUF457 family)
VDIVHHALIGGAGYVVAERADEPLVGAMFLAGSVLPDLDVAFMALGKRFYLRQHQGVTHSLILAPLFALALALPFLHLLSAAWIWSVFFGALAGIWVHLLLDWTNTYGIMLAYPFTRTRYRLDAVFFIDSVALALTAGFYLGFVLFGWIWCAILYPVLFVLYALFKWRQRVGIQRLLRADFVIPSAWNPCGYFVLKEVEGGAETYYYNGWSGRRSRTSIHEDAGSGNYALARRSTLFGDMSGITRALRITEVVESETGTTIHASDLAVRNFGGRFGTTRLFFDREGRLQDETANI